MSTVRILFALFISIFVMVVIMSCGDKKPIPPIAEKIAKVDTLHGDVRTDNYFWLRDKSDSNVINYLKAENRYTEEIMKGTEKFQDDLFQELIGRIKETDLSVPVKIDDYYYYSRTEEGKEYRYYCRKKGSLDADEEIILDHNKMAEGKKYSALGVYEISPDHNLLAYSEDVLGSEKYTIYVKDLRTGTILEDQVPNTSYSLEWANDNKTFFYTIRDDANRPYKMFRHTLGEDPKDDKLIFFEEDERLWLGASKTKDKKFIIIEAGSHTTNEVHYIDADKPTSNPKKIKSQEENVEYYVYHYGSDFYFVTNIDKATNFKLMKAPDSNPLRSNWVDVIPHRVDVKLDGIDFFRDHMAVIEREAGLRKIQIRNMKSGSSHYVEFPEPVYSFGMSSNPDFNTDLIRFTYQSLVTPRSVYDYNMNSKDRELLKEYEVLGGYDKTEYNSERVFATAKDGVKVPISLVYKKGTKLDGTAPLYLYSYGAYGSSMDPYFSTNRISILNRGFVFALAHIRGGGEMGRQWYEDGKMENKINTFTDLIACAEHLVNEKYTSKEKLLTSGGSAGGLTVGAAVNMRPDLFHLVIADVPFVDIVNTMLDETIPLTVLEWDEWGNPNIEEQYRWILEYSPYDNVEAKKYPHMLITTSLNDPRVAYWEPAKWCAKLRDTKTDDNILILKTNMGAGHGGSSGRYERYKEIAFEYAYIFKIFGVKK